MRIFAVIIPLLFIAFSCVKRPSTSPEPTIEYVDFKASKGSNGNDTAVMTIGYEDGDGDLFMPTVSDGPNVVGTFYYYNSGSKQFVGIKDPITKDTARITQTVAQPEETNYKGKPIKGQIFLPWDPFRSGDSVKIFKYTLYMVDQAGHKSNIITTPTYTINF